MGITQRRTDAAAGSVDFGNETSAGSTAGTQVPDVVYDAYFMSSSIRIVLGLGYSTENTCLIGNLHYTMDM